MHLVLLYVPDSDDGDSPFAGIEVALLTNDRQAAVDYYEQIGEQHPEYHFMLTSVGDAVR
jgi:hypothetical protein